MNPMPPTRIPRARTLALLATGVAAAVLAGACGGGDSGQAPDAKTIPQPTRAELAASGLARFPFAPERARIDLVAPSFSDPTDITNRLNPVAEIPSAVVLGEVDGEALRIEITLLPETRVVEWNGQLVECVVSQFVAYREGRMKEVALDLYAQADDGAVWYLGEDVFNYATDGHVADTEGAWLAGRDGPAGIITPASPRVGDVYRSENIAGLVFEESTVKSTGVKVDGPRGPVDGAFVIDEHHPDGAEIKKFAPGYGEFFTRDGRDFEQLALAVPTDALAGPPPPALTRISTKAAKVFDADPPIGWGAAGSVVDGMNAEWAAFRDGDVPPMLAAQMTDSLHGLERAVRAGDRVRARLAAIGVAVAALDLELRHRPPAAIDIARFDLAAAMLQIDANAGDLGAARSDVANLEWIRDRIAHTVDAAVRGRIDARLVELIGAVGDADLAAAGDTAMRLRAALPRSETGSQTPR
jgi:hypothetical protein